MIRTPFSVKAVTTLGELEGLEDQLYLMTEADQLLVTKDGLVGLWKGLRGTNIYIFDLGASFHLHQRWGQGGYGEQGEGGGGARHRCLLRPRLQVTLLGTILIMQCRN